MDLNSFERHESNVRSYIRSFPVVFSKASDSVLWDENGDHYIDFFAGAGALNYGHNDPDLLEPLLAYLREGSIVHGLDFATSAKQEFIETFSRVILEPRGVEFTLQFTGPTGANAVEAALKLARLATGRSGVIAFSQAFHGLSLGALAATSNEKYRASAGVTLRDVVFAPFDGFLGEDADSIDYLERMFREREQLPAAVIVEVVQGEGGVNVARDSWMRGLAELCKRYGVLLIVDDIQAGCGRTGPFFSWESSEIVPDIVTLSKSISGFGLPMSLVLIRPDLDVWEPGAHTGTFRGNNLAFVTATAALNRYWSDDSLEHQVRRSGSRVRERLEAIAARHPEAGFVVRGRGLMWGLASSRQPELAREICGEAFVRGLIIETSGSQGEVVKVMPALTIAEQLLDQGLDVLEASVDAACATVIEGAGVRY